MTPKFQDDRKQIHFRFSKKFKPLLNLDFWQARRESNPQPTVLETATLPIELLA
jgi:hypothetical protein